MEGMKYENNFKDLYEYIIVSLVFHHSIINYSMVIKYTRMEGAAPSILDTKNKKEGIKNE